jgi:hypothetical protein
MRLGELLIEAKVLTADQIDEALRAQVMWGARLGTSLVELGFIDLDGLSNALGYQTGLPAALASHFDRADRELQLQLSANHAEKFGCIPLMRVGKRAVAVAVVSALDARGLAIVADELGVEPDRVIPAIAPELRVRYALEHIYKIPRPQRFLRAPGSGRAAPKQVALPGRTAPALEPPPPPAVPVPVSAHSEASERRRYVQVVGDPELEKRPPPVPRPKRQEVAPDAKPLLERIESAVDREQLARRATATVDQLEPATEAAVLLALRGAVAASMTTFHRDGVELPPIAIPTGLPGVVSTALRLKNLVQASGDQLTELDRKLLDVFGLGRADLLAAPVLAGRRVVAILVVASRAPTEPGPIKAIAQAAGLGLERLMQEAME